MLAAEEKPVFTVTNNAVRDFETYSDSEQKVKTMDGVNKFVRPQLWRSGIRRIAVYCFTTCFSAFNTFQ